MEYVFVNGVGESPESGIPGSRRKMRGKACRSCRIHRVKCDNETPCGQCQIRKVTCKRINNSQIYRPREKSHESLLVYPKASGRPFHKSVVTPTHNESSENGNTTEWSGDAATWPAPDMSNDHSLPKVHPPISYMPETTPPQTAELTSGSITSRINAFFHSAPRTIFQSPRDPIHIEHDGPISIYHTSSLESQCPAITHFSKAEIECILELYWSTLHLDMPILDRHVFEKSYRTLWTEEAEQRAGPPLLDACIALSLQYAHGSDLISRILGLNRARCAYHGDVGLAGFCYLRRCRKTLDEIGTLADPLLTTVQTYVLMSVYLMNAGQYQTAYTIIGLAIRVAQALKLGIESTTSSIHSVTEAETRRSTWWALVQLDLKCAMELQMPVSVHLADISCSFPAIQEHYHGRFMHHIWSARLGRALLQVRELGVFITSDPHNQRSHTKGSTLVARLPELLQPLKAWKEEVLREDDSNSLQLDLPVSTPRLSLPAWQRRQNTRLSLQYHGFLLLLHRPFLGEALTSRLYHDQCAPAPHPHPDMETDTLALTCFQHARAITNIIYDALTTSDCLYGCFELYSYEWSAVLVSVASALTFPGSREAGQAVADLHKALAIFEMGEERHGVARTAARLTRMFRSRFEGSVEENHISSFERQRSVSASQTNGSAPVDEAEVTTPASLVRHVGYDKYDITGYNSTSLWGDDGSWLQDIDPGTWAASIAEPNEFFFEIS